MSGPTKAQIPQMRTPRHLLKPGWLCVILTRPESSLSRRVYAGEVQAVTHLGVRLTLIDWVIGRPVDFDAVLPWSSIEGVELVVTDKHEPMKDWHLAVQAIEARIRA